MENDKLNKQIEKLKLLVPTIKKLKDGDLVIYKEKQIELKAKLIWNEEFDIKTYYYLNGYPISSENDFVHICYALEEFDLCNVNFKQMVITARRKLLQYCFDLREKLYYCSGYIWPDNNEFFKELIKFLY